MSNVQEMPIQADAEDRKRIAKEHYDKIRKAAVVQSRNSLLIGFHAQIMKENNYWGILSFESEHACRKAAGVSESTWFNTIRIAEAFSGLPEDLFCGMKLSNAQVLMDLPESKRMDRDWVVKASEESMETFKRMVDEEMLGRSRPSDTKERSVKMHLSVPASRQAVIESKVAAFAEAHDMDANDMGKVIEVALVEAVGGETFVGAILNAVQRLKKIKELCESGLSSDEILEQVIELNEQSIVEFARVLEVKGSAEEAA